MAFVLKVLLQELEYRHFVLLSYSLRRERVHYSAPFGIHEQSSWFVQDVLINSSIKSVIVAEKS